MKKYEKALKECRLAANKMFKELPINETASWDSATLELRTLMEDFELPINDVTLASIQLSAMLMKSLSQELKSSVDEIALLVMYASSSIDPELNFTDLSP